MRSSKASWWIGFTAGGDGFVRFARDPKAEDASPLGGRVAISDGHVEIFPPAASRNGVHSWIIYSSASVIGACRKDAVDDGENQQRVRCDAMMGISCCLDAAILKAKMGTDKSEASAVVAVGVELGLSFLPPLHFWVYIEISLQQRNNSKCQMVA